jgi:hypothetical protein
MKLKLQGIRQQIAEAGTDAEIKKLRMQEARINLDIHRQFAVPQAQAVLDAALATTAAKQEQATQEVLQTDEAARQARVLSSLTPEEQKARVMGTKPKPAADPAEIAKDLLNKNYELYQKPNGGGTDYARLAKDVNAAIKAGQPGAVDNSRQAALDAARLSVPVGGRYIFEGVERTRSK